MFSCCCVWCDDVDTLWREEEKAFFSSATPSMCLHPSLPNLGLLTATMPSLALLTWLHSVFVAGAHCTMRTYVYCTSIQVQDARVCITTTTISSMYGIYVHENGDSGIVLCSIVPAVGNMPPAALCLPFKRERKSMPCTLLSISEEIVLEMKSQNTYFPLTVLLDIFCWEIISSSELKRKYHNHRLLYVHCNVPYYGISGWH